MSTGSFSVSSSQSSGLSSCVSSQSQSCGVGKAFKLSPAVADCACLHVPPRPCQHFCSLTYVYLCGQLQSNIDQEALHKTLPKFGLHASDDALVQRLEQRSAIGGHKFKLYIGQSHVHDMRQSIVNDENFSVFLLHCVVELQQPLSEQFSRHPRFFVGSVVARQRDVFQAARLGRLSNN